MNSLRRNGASWKGEAMEKGVRKGGFLLVELRLSCSIFLLRCRMVELQKAAGKSLGMLLPFHSDLSRSQLHAGCAGNGF